MSEYDPIYLLSNTLEERLSWIIYLIPKFGSGGISNMQVDLHVIGLVIFSYKNAFFID